MFFGGLERLGLARVRTEAYAEHFVSRDRTLYRETPEGLFQLVRREPLPEGAGYWVTRSLTFDAAPALLLFEAFSYGRPRAVHLSIDGRHKRLLLLETAPRNFKVALEPGGPRRITFSVANCVSPSKAGTGDDTRCLSFWLRGVEPVLKQLFNLTRDSRAVEDVSHAHGRLLGEMEQRLAEYRWEVVATPGKAIPTRLPRNVSVPSGTSNRRAQASEQPANRPQGRRYPPRGRTPHRVERGL